MKINEKKFAFINASAVTILLTVTNLFSRFKIIEQVFVPSPPSRSDLPRTYPFGLSVAIILLVFVVVFTVAWLIAKIYNQHSEQH